MQNIEFSIRRGMPHDAEQLAPLAIKIFNDTFAGHPLNKPEDMRVYISEAFSIEQIRAELSDEETIIFVVENGRQMIGFAKLKKHSTENCVDDADPIELQRFYVAHEFHGLGIAQKLMNECLELAKQQNFQTMWLGVWEHNTRAQNFYRKVGFEKVGTHVFQLGSDPQTDWVMELKL